MASTDACYTLLAAADDGGYAEATGGAALAELKAQLEKGDDAARIAAMQRILNLMSNGDALPQLLMFVIRFVLPSKNKTLKKLLLLYYEMAQKKNPDGKLKQEFILIWCAAHGTARARALTLPAHTFTRAPTLSNAIRNDLQHPNEYVRGSTLRTLCKIREPEILEPLVPSIRANLVRARTLRLAR
jgi:coatomer subunit beta